MARLHRRERATLRRRIGLQCGEVRGGRRILPARRPWPDRGGRAPALRSTPPQPPTSRGRRPGSWLRDTSASAARSAGSAAPRSARARRAATAPPPSSGSRCGPARRSARAAPAKAALPEWPRPGPSRSARARNASAPRHRRARAAPAPRPRQDRRAAGPRSRIRPLARCEPAVLRAFATAASAAATSRARAPISAARPASTGTADSRGAGRPGRAAEIGALERDVEAGSDAAVAQARNTTGTTREPSNVGTADRAGSDLAEAVVMVRRARDDAEARTRSVPGH